MNDERCEYLLFTPEHSFTAPSISQVPRSSFTELKLELPTARELWACISCAECMTVWPIVSGHGPVGTDGTSMCGRLRRTVQKEEGYEAARRRGSICSASAATTIRQPRCDRADRENDRLCQCDATISKIIRP